VVLDDWFRRRLGRVVVVINGKGGSTRALTEEERAALSR
jgi:hypothetical protein